MDSIPVILILDIDEELVLKETNFINDDGAIVIKSSDASDVLRRLEEINPDLIIMGTDVPMINGNLLLTVFRKATHAPILVVGHREELVYMLELGADRFISKPLDKAQFMAVVHSLLRRYSDYAKNGSKNNRVANCRNN